MLSHDSVTMELGDGWDDGARVVLGSGALGVEAAVAAVLRACWALDALSGA
jgi:hypothetical protein